MESQGRGGGGGGGWGWFGGTLVHVKPRREMEA